MKLTVLRLERKKAVSLTELCCDAEDKVGDGELDASDASDGGVSGYSMGCVGSTGAAAAAGLLLLLLLFWFGVEM